MLGCILIALDLLLLVGPNHHLRSHEIMLEDFFRVDALARVQAHDLIEEVDELGVADPFVSVIIEAFLQYGEHVGQAGSEELVLARHYFRIVATGYSEEADVDSTVAIEHEDAAFER